MKDVGKERVVKHSAMNEDVGTTRRLKRRKGIVVIGLFWINFSCTLLPISKEERY